MRKKILSVFLTGALTLTLFSPSASFAQSTDNNIEKGGFYRGYTKAYHQGLDEETKAKLKEIREQVREGTLTKEQAKEELEKLNIKFPFARKGPYQGLDEETKAKLKEIREQVKEGTLTKEQAKEELEKLNIKFPFQRKGPRQNLNK